MTHPITLLAAGGSDFIFYLVAVIVFVSIAGAINRVQQWWADLNKPPTRRPGSPPVATPPRPTPPGQRRRPPATSLPRPVIREQLPESPPTARPPVVRGPTPPPRRTRPARAPTAREKPRPPVRPVEVSQERQQPAPPRPAPATVTPEARAVPAPAARPASQPVPAPVLVMAGVSGVHLSRDELRKAFILNEILSPPVAQRTGE